MSGSYLLYGSILEKCGNFWKNGRFSGRIWPDWGNTAWADMAGLGYIGLGYTSNRPYALSNDESDIILHNVYTNHHRHTLNSQNKLCISTP